MMISEELKNKAELLFPGLLENKVDTVDNANTLASAELWKVVSDKWVDITKKKLAPVRSAIMDVWQDLQVTNPKANPVVQVEVVTGAGSALVDATSFEDTALTNKYVDVKLKHIARPFQLTLKDLTNGERVESKLGAAIESVMQGVYAQYVATAKTAGSQTSLPALTPETAVQIGAIFGASAETDVCILDSVSYAALVPTNGLGLSPETQGVYGINKIYKSYVDGGTTNAIVTAPNGIVGAVGTKELFSDVPGGSARTITVDGIPLMIISKFDFATHSIWVSVETFAGFSVTDNSLVKHIKFQA